MEPMVKKATKRTDLPHVKKSIKKSKVAILPSADGYAWPRLVQNLKPAR